MYDEMQKSFRSIGFDPKLESFNHRILGILAITSLGVISLWIFLFHEADSAAAYVESVYLITVCNGVLLSMASTIFTRKRLFSFIEIHEEFWNESK